MTAKDFDNTTFGEGGHVIVNGKKYEISDVDKKFRWFWVQLNDKPGSLTNFACELCTYIPKK